MIHFTFPLGRGTFCVAFPRYVPPPLIFLSLPVPPVTFQVPSHVVSRAQSL